MGVIAGAGERGARERVMRRLPAVTAAVLLVVLGMNFSFYWSDVVDHHPGVWLDPADQWRTYLAAVNLVHGHFTQIYTQSNGLETFPGILFAISPLAIIGSVLHLEMGPDLAAFTQPTGWLVAGPYELALSSIPIFACDAIAERWRLPESRRWILALAEGAVVTNVALKWGHPEDAVALGLALYAVLDADSGRWVRAAWLIGIAICIQPFAVLALPLLFARLPWRRLPRLIPPVVVPSLIVLAGPLIASWHNTVSTLIDQPNHPNLNHVTPWTSMLPVLHQRLYAVASGPGRAIAIAITFAVGIAVCRRHYRLEVVLALLGVGVLLRLLGEAVLDSFYTWPLLAVAILLAARRSIWRLLTATAIGLFATWWSNLAWHGVWPWWGVMMLLMVAALVVGWPEWASFRAGAPVSADDASPAEAIAVTSNGGAPPVVATSRSPARSGHAPG